MSGGPNACVTICSYCPAIALICCTSVCAHVPGTDLRMGHSWSVLLIAALLVKIAPTSCFGMKGNHVVAVIDKLAIGCSRYVGVHAVSRQSAADSTLTTQL